MVIDRDHETPALGDRHLRRIWSASFAWAYFHPLQKSNNRFSGQPMLRKKERKKEIGLMVIPRVFKFLVTGPSLSISESG
jgi:hypothetical protein